MHFEVLTIFPEIFGGFLDASLVGKAIEGGLLDVNVTDLRDFSEGRHRTVDDEPYGGGGGMVMTAPPWLAAMRSVTEEAPAWRVLLSPQGRALDDALVRELASYPRIVLMCGRYEGIDERVRELVVDQEISIGDYVLSGGELAAMVLIEAVSRQIPGVVGLRSSVENDSFREGLLDHPHYTRPASVEGRAVPGVLLSGNHAEIDRWRRHQALRATFERRPDLLAGAPLEARERSQVERWRREAEDVQSESGEDLQLPPKTTDNG